MVYSGKPSKACDNCRKRKIKCDQATPSCLQCRQARFSCSGYRDLSQLYFRDQSREVAQKAQRTYTSVAFRRRRISKFQNQQEPDNLLHAPRNLSTPSKQQAICIFLHEYVLDDSELNKAHLTTSQMVNQASSSGAVHHAISSIGLAILSNLRNDVSLMVQAKNEYCSVLGLTNLALRHKSEYLLPTTLNAVILLGTFEVMACRNSRSLENWQKHINGAAALLDLWDANQIPTTTSIQLFTQLRVEIIANCLRTQTHIPNTVIQLSRLSKYYRSEDSTYADDLVNLVAQVCNFLADIRGKKETNGTEIITRARFIDGTLRNWSLHLPLRWCYSVHHIPNHQQHFTREHTYNEHCHIYDDLWSCNVWGYYRTARIIINLVIRDGLLSCPSLSPEWYFMIDEAKLNIK